MTGLGVTGSTIASGDTIEAEIETTGVFVNPVISSKANLEYTKKVGLT